MKTKFCSSCRRYVAAKILQAHHPFSEPINQSIKKLSEQKQKLASASYAFFLNARLDEDLSFM